jgi:tellurite resistance protein TerC
MNGATPLSHWIGFHVFIVVLLGVELFYARRRGPQRVHSTAVAATVLWIAAALLFAVFIRSVLGGQYAIQYVAGYAIEEALSVDNLFVFLLLFRLFRIEHNTQPRVLFWGVAGAIVMRGLFIAGGLDLLARFSWVGYVFAAILLIAAVRLLLPKQNETACPGWLAWLTQIKPVSPRQDRFFVVENGHRMVTVLLLALVAIELTDVAFALDSIPAVLSITRHPFLAYTSNIMAVMGLRSLYFLLAAMLSKLRWLNFGLAMVLAFAAGKMLLARIVEIGPLLSLAVIVAVLGVTIAASLLAPSADVSSAD